MASDLARFSTFAYVVCGESVLGRPWCSGCFCRSNIPIRHVCRLNKVQTRSILASILSTHLPQYSCSTLCIASTGPRDPVTNVETTRCVRRHSHHSPTVIEQGQDGFVAGPSGVSVRHTQFDAAAGDDLRGRIFLLETAYTHYIHIARTKKVDSHIKKSRAPRATGFLFPSCVHSSCSQF